MNDIRVFTTSDDDQREREREAIYHSTSKQGERGRGRDRQTDREGKERERVRESQTDTQTETEREKGDREEGKREALLQCVDQVMVLLCVMSFKRHLSIYINQPLASYLFISLKR